MYIALVLPADIRAIIDRAAIAVPASQTADAPASNVVPFKRPAKR